MTCAERYHLPTHPGLPGCRIFVVQPSSGQNCQNSNKQYGSVTYPVGNCGKLWVGKTSQEYPPIVASDTYYGRHWNSATAIAARSANGSSINVSLASLRSFIGTPSGVKGAGRLIGGSACPPAIRKQMRRVREAWGSTCGHHTTTRMRHCVKSRDNSCRAGTPLSLNRNSARSAGFCGHTKRLLTLRRLLEIETSERPSDGWLANTTRRSSSCSPSWRKCSTGADQ